ncbi:Anaerobic ribonucleoside-triphosphate reductase [Andreprevotia lacus DSM 23236]|jgi:anaerobic ribonucleoside-triphosphate reductase|uniref:Anaerobic ribonucleoside-triphosphate reductase n=1 Tax=Andreprevotia lacus DSM 23236 TaxID=1121001 RepID=A0A1W1XX89_9NEIS|nr:anaerobic ribonucleoside-triphosphate reductase [Andreprevotia lacus]SMC28464.1 Anaerobic ribonucleoside-triphosphate reductase [Andreprevotia lacus DSM 23236]
MNTVTAEKPQTRQLDNAQRTRCEVWTRVMGYHRPVTSFNKGKQGEFNERCFFVERSKR